MNLMKILAAALAVAGTYLLAPQLFPSSTEDKLARASRWLWKSVSIRLPRVRHQLLEPLHNNRLETNIWKTHRTATITTFIAWLVFLILTGLTVHALILILVIPLTFAAVYWLLIEPRGERRFARRIPRAIADVLLFLSLPLLLVGWVFLYVGWMVAIYVCILFEALWFLAFAGAYFGLRGQLILASWASREPPERVAGFIGFLLLILAAVITVFY